MQLSRRSALAREQSRNLSLYREGLEGFDIDSFLYYQLSLLVALENCFHTDGR